MIEPRCVPSVGVVVIIRIRVSKLGAVYSAPSMSRDNHLISILILNIVNRPTSQPKKKMKRKMKTTVFKANVFRLDRFLQSTERMQGKKSGITVTVTITVNSINTDPKCPCWPLHPFQSNYAVR